MNSSEKEFLLSLFSFNSKLSDNEKIKKLYIISNNIENYYRKFEIKKRNSKKRNILSPCKELKCIQHNILNILYEKKPSIYAKAYIKNIHLIDNVKIHKSHNYILKLDISNFFENISYVDIYNIFREYGFSDRICGLLSHLTTYNDYLPQGSPTSPHLSNLVLRYFDYEVGNWCKKRNINYTRYSDDMTFSMNEYNNEIIRFIRVKLYKLGLELNNRKICLIKRSKKQKITGIVVNEKLQVDIKYRRKIRQEIYYIKKYGLDEHLKVINEEKDCYLNSLYGRIMFVLSIDKKNKEFIEYRKLIFSIKKTQK